MIVLGSSQPHIWRIEDKWGFPLSLFKWLHNKAYTASERSGWYNVEMVRGSFLTQFGRQVGSTNWKFEERDEGNIGVRRCFHLRSLLPRRRLVGMMM
jgi:hypothetical protein